ncbi:putative receptor-like protein kinase At5g39000 [Bidens hawaiensis]|uniref:putative receptor-like protein kinase At5g39000 n=1 Tax=Bidens hawaiensis TaxID=980011 RepID=UPI00404B8ECF
MSFPTRHTGESSSSSSLHSLPLCHQFTFAEIELATRNFDESLVIGRGGFGKVYRGTITHGGIHLDAAIKRLESGSNQGAVEFWAEVETLSKLRHCHLVSLIGYCNEGQEMILVYEYIPNGTLADRLHKRRAPLTWVRRLKICIGAARGLDYLHSGTGIKHGVIHRDVKSTNILLDENWAAKVSDFGLSKIGPTNQPYTYVSTLVKGTFGYLDPDYLQTGRLTRKSDVYAFGVVLFEVLCGKKAVDRSIDEEQWGLATWAQDSIKEGRLEQIVDANIRGRIFTKCLKEFALLADRCLHSRPKQRPTMAEVVVGLESILALQEKTDSTWVSTFLFPSNKESPVGSTLLKSLSIYLYTVGGEDRIVHLFDYNTVVYATEDFSEANKILCCTYESMYKGRLLNGQDIAIAQYSYAYTFEKCMNEATILVKFEHENAIQLLGYCIHGRKMYLLYDFAPYATLDGLLFDPMCNLLDWNKRYKIILGVARVLVYLHNHAPVRIIHRDVKPSNILLDKSFHPKLSGFGLATAINKTDCIHVDRLSETFGCMAPEYLKGEYLSAKADVFSLGMLILVTVTGKRSGSGVRLKDYVKRNWVEGTLLDIIDPKIDVESSILMTKFIEIGLLCVQRNPAVRPTMEEVVDMLLGTASLTLRVSEMRARVKPWIISEDSDTGLVDELISELCPR